MLRQPRVKSKFKKNEEFNFRDVPKKFESVTQGSIRELRSYCFNRAEKTLQGDFTPGALKPILETIVGSFNFPLAQLEADYSARKKNLEIAKIAGIAEIHAQIFDFEKLVEQHNEAYDEYATAYKRIYGETPSGVGTMKVSQAKVDSIIKAYEALEK